MCTFLCVCVYIYIYIPPFNVPAALQGTFWLKPVPSVFGKSLSLCLCFDDEALDPPKQKKLRRRGLWPAKAKTDGVAVPPNIGVRSPPVRSVRRPLSTRSLLAHGNKKLFHSFAQGLGFGRENDLGYRLDPCINIQTSGRHMLPALKCPLGLPVCKRL